MEARLGTFGEPAERQAQKPARQYQPRPMPSRVDTAELYAKYQAERKAAQGLGAQVWREAKGKKRRLIEDAKRRGRLKRAAIKLMGGASIRDDGKVLAIARGATQEGLAEALCLAMQRYGERIAVNGSEEFREQIAQAAAKALSRFASTTPRWKSTGRNCWRNANS